MGVAKQSGIGKSETIEITGISYMDSDRQRHSYRAPPVKKTRELSHDFVMWVNFSLEPSNFHDAPTRKVLCFTRRVD
jgi:hypothetical protein